MRTALGVVFGYAFFFVGAVLIFAVSGRDPQAAAETGFMVVSTIGGMAAALIAGLLASTISRRHDLRASMIVATIIAVIAVVSMLTLPAGGHRWSMIVALVFMAPCALAGGLIYHRLRAAHAG